ncbi:MAG: ABC transporter ATP-binding protein [Geminicoccaceae bacterium]
MTGSSADALKTFDWWGLSLRLVREHVTGQRLWLAVALGCMVLVAGATAMYAKLLEPVLDRVFINKSEAALLVIPVVVVIVALIKSGATYVQSVIMIRIGQRIIADMQHRVVARLIHADLTFFVERSTGSLVSNLIYDVNLLRAGVSTAVTGLVRDGLTVIFLAALMLYQDWQLALIALIGFPLSIIPIRIIGRRTRELATDGQEHMGRITSRLEEIITGIRQVQAYRREEDETARVGRQIEDMFHLQVLIARVKNLASPLTEAIAGLAVGAVIYYGGSKVMAGETTPGAFISFVGAILMAYQPAKNLAKINSSIQEALSAARRLYEIIDRPYLIADKDHAKPLELRTGAIRFEQVSFAYDTTRSALNDINLDVEPGTTVALVGPSGGGKTTLLNLLLRFYDVDNGRVLIDDQDVRDVTLDSLRRSIALVSQQINLFDDTVRANIAYGRPSATEEEIVSAAKAAAVHDFVAGLPKGYDTPIGEAGLSLSGGQRQRLSIARALVKDAPILLLDEATSALDSESERHVQAALEHLMQGRTTLVIAHRLSTIIHADKIAMIDRGRIVETGTHRELITAGGAYSRLYDLQYATDRRPTAHPAVDAVIA